MELTKLYEELREKAKNTKCESFIEHLIILRQERNRMAEHLCDNDNIICMRDINSNLDELLVVVCGIILGKTRPTKKEMADILLSNE